MYCVDYKNKNQKRRTTAAFHHVLGFVTSMFTKGCEMFGFRSLKELYTVLSAKPVGGGRFKVLLIAKFASDVALNVFFYSF